MRTLCRTDRRGAMTAGASELTWDASQRLPRVPACPGVEPQGGGDFFVDWRPIDGTAWQQVRMARLAEAGAGAEVLVRPHACAPQGPGYAARFGEIRLDLA